MSCLLSTRIEAELFDKYTDNDVPNDNCPICLEPLNKRNQNACCDGYARKLKCGHFVHVCCHINKNPDLLRCSVCRFQLAPIDIYYKICKSMVINILPLHYQRPCWNDTLSGKMIDDITKNYKIDYNHIIKCLEYLETIKLDEKLLHEYFVTNWIHRKK